MADALTGFVGFALLYFCLLATIFHVWPGFLRHWNHDHPWFRPILGVPMAELVWAGTFGAAWPLVVAYAADVPSRQRGEVRQARNKRGEW